MDTILITPEEHYSPFILINKEKGKVSIEGYAALEDPHVFWNNIKEKIKSIKKEKITFNVNLSYFNSGSYKMIYEVFKSFPEKEVIINWQYRDWDTDLYQDGKDFKEFLSVYDNIKLNLVEI